VEVVIHLPLRVVEELLLEWVGSWVLGIVVVVVDFMISFGRTSYSRQLTGLFQGFGITSDLFGELLTPVDPLHQSSTDIVLAVPLNLLCRSTVQDQSNRELEISNSLPSFYTRH
jgi:hypothetical protein